MKNISMRSAFISVAAIGGAIVWGTGEFLALQRSRLADRLRAMGRFRTR